MSKDKEEELIKKLRDKAIDPPLVDSTLEFYNGIKIWVGESDKGYHLSVDTPENMHYEILLHNEWGIVPLWSEKRDDK